MESAEHELLRTAGVAVVDRLPDDGATASWPRVSASCDYKAAVRFGDVVDISVGVVEIGRSSVTFGFRFEHEGTFVAEGRIVAVRCLMHAGRKPEPVAIPAEIIERLDQFRIAP
jgi:4-hydroxybenzoyl-CoA thioesterase/acyl-CoA thioester hydrolase